MGGSAYLAAARDVYAMDGLNEVTNFEMGKRILHARQMNELVFTLWSQIPNEDDDSAFCCRLAMLLGLGTSHVEVTDPRDIIYSLLGVTNVLIGTNHVPGQLWPGYTCSVSSLYHSTTVLMLLIWGPNISGFFSTPPEVFKMSPHRLGSEISAPWSPCLMQSGLSWLIKARNGKSQYPHAKPGYLFR